MNSNLIPLHQFENDRAVQINLVLSGIKATFIIASWKIKHYMTNYRSGINFIDENEQV